MTAATVRPLLVAETFTSTVQGEGPSLGQQATFVRLSRCNLSCPRCDTPYTWDTSRYDLRTQSRRLLPAEVTDWVLSTSADLVVITGGEPLLQQAGVTPVVVALAQAGRRVEIETSGTVVPRDELAAAVRGFNVSPKLASFAAPADMIRRINPAALAALTATGKAAFKFVATNINDLDEISELVDQFGLAPVWVMPEGTDPTVVLDRMRLLAGPVIERGWNLTTRLHILLWGDLRGR
ncbi:7-carboxy-7-deazaguanine synthase QueE [Plantactinospora sp. CA-290183]|uniref:7-carboxy-7-deazaguanine synthase QueE n=1 Tax=Plantactinospora sp. CA-290183 TaxID=3240006 RepID=UPI003D8E919B